MNTLIRKIRFIKLGLVLVSLFGMISCGGGSGGGGNQISNPVIPGDDFSSPTLTVPDTSPVAGTTFDIIITVPDALNLYQADIEMDYDHSIIELVSSPTPSGSVTVGNIFPLQNSTYLDNNTANNVILNFYGAGAYAGQTGTLCTITFQAVSAGTTTINFSTVSGVNTGSVYTYTDTGPTNPGISSVVITVI